jgi:peptide/nickel transport system substrate-binding protein
MKSLTRLMGLGIVCLMMLTLVVGVASAQDGVTIVVGFDQEPPQLYPMANMVQSGNLEEFYARDVWNWDYDNNIYPVMVAEIPTVENGMVTTNDEGNTVVTYTLREGMVWSDGEPITSADCAFWHEIAMDPTKSVQYARGNYPTVVESLEVVDDLTFTLTYNTPWPDYQVDSYARCSYPEHILRPALEADGHIDNAPQWAGEGVVGYGPWVLTEWVVGDTITFDRNPNWDGQSPAIDRVIVKYIPDSAQMQSAMETGEIDMSFLWADDQIAGYSAIPGVEIWADPSVLADAIWINMTESAHPALADVRVRQAIAHALDREAMSEGLAVGAPVPVSWWFPKFQPDDLVVYGYDVDAANALLDEAGWTDTNDNGIRDKDGTELVLRFFTTTRQQRMDYQVLIQEYLNAVGISTQLFPVPATILFDTYSNRGIVNSYDYDLALFASTQSLTPISQDAFSCDQKASPENPAGAGNVGYCNPEWDELDALINTTVDEEERLAYHHDMERLFNSELFWIGLFIRTTNYALNTDRFNLESFQGGGTYSINYFRRSEFWLPAS